MSKLLSVAIALIGLSLIAEDVDARRLGGGRNLGTQRSITQQPAPKAPAQQQQAQQQQAAPATPAQQPSGLSKWLGPLAGLALGAGLAALFFNNGLAGFLAGLLMIAAFIAVAMFVARALRGKVAQQPMQYAGAGGAGPPLAALPGGAGVHSVAATAGRWPAGFDAADFARHA
ncbi:MAG: Tim44 domain-containing protein, partial [Betaproteobacteria bacterium]|nr:Tim44 domain-containing protein [Betaproteobacteria bacterium]